MESVASAIVGRDSELAELRGLIDSLPQSQLVQVLEVCGPAGMGKSRLLQYAQDYATAADISVCFVRAARTEQDLQFAHLNLLIEDLLVNLAEQNLIDQYDVGDLAMVIPGLRPLVVPHAVTDQLDLRLISHATATALGVAAREANGLLLCIDDQQWIDDSSWYVLDYLIRHCPDSPILIICAMRPGPVGQSRPSSSLVSADAVGVMELEPLDPDAAQVLVRDVTVGSRQLILDAAQGNPFYLRS